MAGQATLAIVVTAKDLASGVLKGVEGSLTSASGKLSSFGAGATALGGQLSLGLTAPIAALGVVSFKAASDMAESLSKVGVVFGESAGDIEEFAKSAATNLGLSKQATLEATGTLGNLFVAMGQSKSASAEMSKSVVSLASDLASFNNIGTDVALEKLRAGLVGEAEPLRALGVNMNEAAVKAKALELGLAGADGELTESAKIQARLAIILEQTKTAQGDFARTSEGVANSTRIATAKLQDLSAQLGEKLLPIGLKVITALTGLVDRFSALSPEMQTTVTVGAGLLAVLGPVTAAVGTLASAIGFLTAVATRQTAATVAMKVAQLAATVATAAMTAAQWLLNVALSANPIGLVVLALAGLALGIKLAYDNSATFRNIVDTIATLFVDSFEPALKAGDLAARGLTTAARGAASLFTDTFKPALGGVTDFINMLVSAFQTAVSWVNGLISAVNTLIEAYNRLRGVSPDGGGSSVQTLSGGGSVSGGGGLTLSSGVVGGGLVTRGGVNVTINVQGSVITERDLAQTVRSALIRDGRSLTSLGLA